LKTGEIDFVSLINMRPNFNNSQEVTDLETRRKMQNLVKEIFKT
jgi:hypothetical protein